VSDKILIGDLYAIPMLDKEPPPCAQKKAAE
jgi:hypothetical protein